MTSLKLFVPIIPGHIWMFTIDSPTKPCVRTWYAQQYHPLVPGNSKIYTGKKKNTRQTEPQRFHQSPGPLNLISISRSQCECHIHLVYIYMFFVLCMLVPFPVYESWFHARTLTQRESNTASVGCTQPYTKWGEPKRNQNQIKKKNKNSLYINSSKCQATSLWSALTYIQSYLWIHLGGYHADIHVEASVKTPAQLNWPTKRTQSIRCLAYKYHTKKIQFSDSQRHNGAADLRPKQSLY